MDITAICMIAGGAVAGVALVYVIVCGMVIRRRHIEMNNYGIFIHRTYVEEGKNVPVLILRHYKAYIDKYNRARLLAPFRYFLRREPADNLHERFPEFGKGVTARPKELNNVKYQKHNRK